MVEDIVINFVVSGFLIVVDVSGFCGWSYFFDLEFVDVIGIFNGCVKFKWDERFVGDIDCDFRLLKVMCCRYGDLFFVVLIGI